MHGCNTSKPNKLERFIPGVINVVPAGTRSPARTKQAARGPDLKIALA